MATKQLETLLKFERDNEQKIIQELQLAEQDYQHNIQRLSSVQDYRLEYMKRVEKRSMEGIDSATYAHFHAFVQKLDNAGEQVQMAITQAKSLVEQKKRFWMEQRRKVQAVEMLLENQKKKLQAVKQRQEQKMFDEIATQQFIRRRIQ